MADAKQCDRCRVLYIVKYDDKSPSIDERQIRGISLYDSWGNRVGEHLDLCPKCANELVRWLDSYSYMRAPISYDLPIEGDVKEVSYDAGQDVTGDDEDKNSSREDSKESGKD